MSETMIERIARSMFDTFMDWQFGSPIGWDGNPPANADELEREWREGEWREQKEYHLRLAIAAIEAMADPTPAMLEAGEENCGFDGYVNYFEPAIPYRAMIFAALSQSPSLPIPAATPTDSANPPPVESVGPNSEAQS